MATEAAGEGINLQCCHVMINFDLPWNPCRILTSGWAAFTVMGQASPQVHIFNMLAGNSLEDEVKKAIIAKQLRMRERPGRQGVRCTEQHGMER